MKMTEFVWLFLSIYAYSLIFTIIGLLPSKKFKKTDKKYNYAVLIPARNEAKDIKICIDSILKQDYPKEKITIFVVAHNCTDNTAELARECGVNVFEYNNPKERKKGYALDWLVKKIKELYGDVYAFDGYFICDADTAMKPNYVTEMNNAFDNKKYAMVVSNRSVKNETNAFTLFASIKHQENCISNRGKSLLGLNISCIGGLYLLRNFVLHDGYKYKGMSDDMETTYDLCARGYQSTYVNSAIFFI
jgi:cellulose synthase/poly-beta-1,6-N-acetylglucosamine synthase-like glycosyltransferase